MYFRGLGATLEVGQHCKTKTVLSKGNNPMNPCKMWNNETIYDFPPEHMARAEVDCVPEAQLLWWVALEKVLEFSVSLMPWHELKTP